MVKFGPRGIRCGMFNGPPRNTPPVMLLYDGFEDSCPLKEYCRASSAELSSFRLNPPVYRLLVPFRVFPNAGASVNCDVAALFTLPLTRRPSEFSGGLGISAVSAGFDAWLLPGAAATSGAGTGGGWAFTILVCAMIWSSGSIFSSHLRLGILDVTVTSCWIVAKH